MDKLALQQANYQWQLACINSADTKAGFLITIDLTLIGFLITQLDEILGRSFLSRSVSSYTIVFLSCLAFFALLSLFYSARAIWPRFSTDCTSIFYFKSILCRDKDQYVKEIDSIGFDDVLKDLNGQVWELSRIAIKKYKDVRTGLWLYGISILFLSAMYIQKAIYG